jgi:hypothetical protein
MKVIEGIFKNGEIFLMEEIDFEYAKVKVIFDEEQTDENDGFLLRDRLKVKTKNFKFNRDELYDRQSIS